MKAYSYSFNDIKNTTSQELIDLLSDLGYGTRYNQPGDLRTAQIYETGTFTKTGESYAKIVVHVDDSLLFDYGVRLFVIDL